MFHTLGRFVVRHPWLTIAAWVVIAVVLATTAPKLSTNQDQASFLPSKYESIKASELAEKAFPSPEGSSALMVFQRKDKAALSQTDQDNISSIAEKLQQKQIDNIETVQTGPEAIAENKKIQLVNVSITNDISNEKTLQAVTDLRKQTKPLVSGSALTVGVTGDAAFWLDSEEAFKDADTIVAVTTIILILVLLLLIFRSPIAALLPIIIVFVVQIVSVALISFSNEWFNLKADNSITSILTVVLFGIGTDYILFLLFRYRERLRAGEDRKQAMVTAVSKVGEVIASAAAVVIIAFCGLLLSSMGMLHSMGPALAIAVGTTLIAGLTLVPAAVSLIGPKVFWPSKSWKTEPKGQTASRLGRLVGQRPVHVAVVSGLIMALLALGAFSYNADYDFNASTPKTTESAKAFKDMQIGFPAGALNPTTVFLENTRGGVLTQEQVSTFSNKLEEIKGVGSVNPAQFNPEKTVARIDLLLTTSPSSNQALSTVSGPVRDGAHEAAPPGTRALVGGSTAVMADVRDAINHDYTIVFPVAGILIMIVLGLLLRSVVAPWYLIAAVVLGFGATLGTSVLVFQHILGHPGLSFQIPLIMYLFVVALGTDYNILMVARLREEAKAGHSPREAATYAIKRTAPTIAAAGVILAGTFGSMLLAGVTMMTEMGFAVATGIVIAAFVMSMFFVPAITALLGHKAWWPGHSDEPDKRSSASSENSNVSQLS